MYILADEHSFPSATWVCEPDKIRPPARATGAAARSATFRLKLIRRDARKPLTATLRYRGGPEGWVQVEARGRTYRFPGHVCVYDALMRITAGYAEVPR